MINSTSPFYISLVDIESAIQGFIVNAGDVNSFILGTYKAKYDEIKGKNAIEETDYYARVGEGGSISKTFKFGSDWTPTFYTSTNCDVYLTIPKIPAAFNAIPSEGEGLRKDWWLKPSVGNINFLNQFKIVKNTDEGFEEEKTKNINSINKDDKDWSKPLPNKTQFLTDSEYSGKMYIKLANIESSNVNYFFRSNVISPTRYIRYGSLGLRNLRLFVDVFGLISESVDIGNQNGYNNNNWKITDFFHERSYDNFRFPGIFDFRESDLNDQTIVNAVQSIVDLFIPKWYYSYLRGKTIDRNRGVYLKMSTSTSGLVSFQCRILAVYKNKLGEKLNIIKLKEDITAINQLVEDANRSIGGHKGVLGTISKFKAMTKKEAIERIFSWPESALTRAEQLITFTNFAE
jgi:hypothetical protein